SIVLLDREVLFALTATRRLDVDEDDVAFQLGQADGAAFVSGELEVRKDLVCLGAEVPGEEDRKEKEEDRDRSSVHRLFFERPRTGRLFPASTPGPCSEDSPTARDRPLAPNSELPVTPEQGPIFASVQGKAPGRSSAAG